MWGFLATLVGHRGKRQGLGDSTSHHLPPCLWTVMGISKNVKAGVLSQWEVQSSGQEWGRYSGGWVLLQAGAEMGPRFFSSFCLCFPTVLVFSGRYNRNTID